MSDITLSKAVRANLLSLQNTATMMDKTQNRLATGNKVNSALDNPTNFFTASALNARAGDMAALMDGMANGVQTLTAADKGLTAITKNLESMQSTLRQARQDKSFQTASYTMEDIAGGKLNFAGGAIGDKGVNVNLTEATPASITSGIEYGAAAKGPEDLKAEAAFPALGVDIEADALEFTIQGATGTPAVSFVIDEYTTGVADPKQLQLDELVTIVNKKLSDYGSTIRARSDGGHLELTETDKTKKGAAAQISITPNDATVPAPGGSAERLGFTYDAVAADSQIGVGNGSNGANASTWTFTVDGAATGGSPVSITLDGNVQDTAQKAADFVNVKLAEAVRAGELPGATAGEIASGRSAKDLRATVVDGKLSISGPADGSPKTIALGGGNVTDLFGAVADRTEVAASESSGKAKKIDTLVHEINNNADLKGKIRASNDNGKLRIENLSTQELNIDGVSSSGAIDGISTGSSKIGGNSVRTSLADQFNELRDQLDKLADDSSFNGTNLLRGDKLTITFNESNTSSIDIQMKGGDSLNAAYLKLIDITAEELDSDTNIDKMLNTLKEALTTVRAQASSFGSNLSSVQNRQDFTKNMINTLETGAANLTLADSNAEAANLLALQTRQQMSSSALSMASQQDQAVLQLLR